MMKLTRKQLRRLIQEAFYLPNRLLHDEDLMAHVKNMRKNHYSKEEIEKADMLTNMPDDPWALDSGIQLGGLPYDREDKPTIDFLPTAKSFPKFVFPPELGPGKYEYGSFIEGNDIKDAAIEMDEAIYDFIISSEKSQKIYDANDPEDLPYYLLPLNEVYRFMAGEGVSKDVIDFALSISYYAKPLKIDGVDYLKVEEQ